MSDIKKRKIGFIGYGNMAGATARGLILSGAVEPEQIYVCAKDYEKLCIKAEADGVKPCRNAEELSNICDVIFIGVKPYMVKDVMSPLKKILRGKLVISLAANTYCKELSEIMPEAHVVATAPNTPVSVCEGIFICEEENTLRAYGNRRSYSRLRPCIYCDVYGGSRRRRLQTRTHKTVRLQAGGSDAGRHRKNGYAVGRTPGTDERRRLLAVGHNHSRSVRLGEKRFQVCRHRRSRSNTKQGQRQTLIIT